MQSNNPPHRETVRWGVELTPDLPPREVAALGASAEAAGFDAAFASCHYNNRDPFVALDRLAAATETIRLGPGVANPYDTHPARLASQAATLNEVSDGRALLGVGAGDRSTLANLGIERERPLRAVLETMQVARRLWAGERVDHDGTVRVTDAGLNYEADPLPVFVGGQGPHMLRMAGKHADGVLINAAHPADYEWASEQVAIGREQRPDDRGPFTAAAFASVSIARDAAAARDAARPPVAFIASGAPEPVLERHGIDLELARDVGEAIEAGEFERAFGLVTPDLVDAFCVAGTPADVAERIATIREYTDAFVAASPLGPDRETAIELLGDVRARLADPEVAQ
ncbi:5,10-methylenetetrahydromethanopterin reductase [Haloarculaceae archaeon H-GB2-1]|nr:5,10-methylenetetrahydromethanopterin reductase [Haloarculaceae archaeon H-GB1-1]MEA5407233.1 5,10-methylenetetrahydromethanopterin reductase [Haloarculaceae archaeon H-GB2-1]